MQRLNKQAGALLNHEKFPVGFTKCGHLLRFFEMYERVLVSVRWFFFFYIHIYTINISEQLFQLSYTRQVAFSPYCSVRKKVASNMVYQPRSLLILVNFILFIQVYSTPYFSGFGVLPHCYLSAPPLLLPQSQNGLYLLNHRMSYTLSAERNCKFTRMGRDPSHWIH